MITSTTGKSVYTITSGVTSYAIGFLYHYNPDDTPQFLVYTKEHPEEPLAYLTNYTISADGLNVELIDGYEVGDTLVILRNIPFRQISDYIVGRIDPEQIEGDFDESVMRDQQLAAELDLLEELPINHEERIQAIEAVIPEDATASNQLTDKDYVDTLVSNHTNRTDNPHSVTATQVGLGNCDNTSDLDKPVSTATQNALNLKANSADLATVATSGNYSDLNNTPSIMTGASAGDAGTSGLVPAPAAGDQAKFLQGDGTWANPTATTAWGNITGTLSNQTDLQNALDGKLSTSGGTTTNDIIATNTNESRGALSIKNTTYAYDEDPSVGTETGSLDILDKNGAVLSRFGTEKYEDGTNVAKMQITQNVSGVSTIGSLRLRIDKTGYISLTTDASVWSQFAGSSMPDYSAGVSLSNISSYQQITDNGYILFTGSGGGSWGDVGVSLSLDASSDIATITIANPYEVTMLIPIQKGTYVKKYGITSSIIFYPCKKENY